MKFVHDRSGYTAVYLNHDTNRPDIAAEIVPCSDGFRIWEGATDLDLSGAVFATHEEAVSFIKTNIVPAAS